MSRDAQQMIRLERAISTKECDNCWRKVSRLVARTKGLISDQSGSVSTPLVSAVQDMRDLEEPLKDVRKVCNRAMNAPNEYELSSRNLRKRSAKAAGTEEMAPPELKLVKL